MTVMSETRVVSGKSFLLAGQAIRTRGGSLFLSTQSDDPCGVEIFTRKLIAALKTSAPDSGYELRCVSGRWRDLPAFPAGLAVLLALLGWQLVRLRSWARGPAIVLELLLAPLGYYMVIGGAAWLGIPAIVAGLACTGLLVAPASRQALGIR